jgi:hypothetical protein
VHRGSTICTPSPEISRTQGMLAGARVTRYPRPRARACLFLAAAVVLLRCSNAGSRDVGGVYAHVQGRIVDSRGTPVSQAIVRVRAYVPGTRPPQLFVGDSFITRQDGSYGLTLFVPLADVVSAPAVVSVSPPAGAGLSSGLKDGLRLTFAHGQARETLFVDVSLAPGP